MTDPSRPGPAEAATQPEDLATSRVGWDFVLLYALAYMGTILLFLARLLVSLSLKVNSLVGIQQGPNSLSLVAGTGALLALFANPFFGKLSDRTSSGLGMRRPWMVTGLVGGSLGFSSSHWHPASRSSWSDGAWHRCSSTRCSPPWWRCSRTRCPSPNAAWSRVF